MEIGIFGSHIVWRIRHREIRREAKETGRSIEEVLEEKEKQDSVTSNADLESQTPVVDSKVEDYH